MTIETVAMATEPTDGPVAGSVHPMPAVTVVVLTMGDRPTELAAAIDSARRQPVDVEIVLVVNGGDPDRSLGDVVVEPGENLGIPEGRNVGAAEGTADVICFLDDDGELDGDVFGPPSTPSPPTTGSA